MNPISTAYRGLTKVADATTAAAGAVGGAAVSGAVGAVQGVATGVRSGVSSGSRSSAAAALTLGAIGAAGLVEWPVLLTVGGAALVMHQLGHRGDGASPEQQESPPVEKAAARPVKAARKTTASRRTK
ncbi:hypothetical protein C6A87_027635 [Mycobacterium sp. ITM-2016-00317]|uniref:hypothetical protein n=1 Tax=Mycobacterium sp. ITM-2016-00317 TaxID=2099694 RepID=UPI000D4832F2|nr:hypothetical protein [Mycobacterium sp. ITM-2016-00317]WNG87463.1 hypothetical protein C6A87_027635 [Mycobacterium sp. ITM-2016-00317]